MKKKTIQYKMMYKDINYATVLRENHSCKECVFDSKKECPVSNGYNYHCCGFKNDDGKSRVWKVK